MHKVLVGNPEERRPLDEARRRWKDNIKMIFRSCGLNYSESGDSCEHGNELSVP